jgi:uncharacterized protein (TIGR02246 family)
MHKLRSVLLAAMVVPWLTVAALAQQEVAPQLAQREAAARPAPVDDEATIRASADKYVELYNHRDAKGMADMWSPDAVYTDATSGEQYTGREAIAEHFADMFAGMEDAKLKVTVGAVEFVSPNVAIERGSAVVTSSEQDSEESTYSAVHVKRDGKWLIDRISEEAVAPPPPSHYEHLKALEWMVGDWVDSDEEATVETNVEWAKNRNFLRRSFAVVTADDIPLSGVQIIGWDPNDKCIRSWTFDSDGGFAEGTWSREGTTWHIRNKATLPGGGAASAVNILTEVDENSFLWESISREVEGELLPNVDPVLIVRAAMAGSNADAESTLAPTAASAAVEASNP